MRREASVYGYALKAATVYGTTPRTALGDHPYNM